MYMYMKGTAAVLVRSDVKDINGFVKIMEMAVVKTQSGGRDTQID